MADTTTANYGLVKPEVGASNDTWGNKTNSNWDVIDVSVKFALDTANAAMPKGGGTFTGPVTFGGLANFTALNDGGGNPIITFDAGSDFFGFNRAGNYFDWYIAGTSRMQLGVGGITLQSALAVGGNLSIGGTTTFAGDANFVAQMIGGNPILAVSGNSLYGFNRGANFHDFNVAGTSRVRIGTTGLDVTGGISATGAITASGAISVTGTATFGSNVFAPSFQASAAGVGGVATFLGNSAQTGYISFRDSSGAQRSYIGFSPFAGALNFSCANGFTFDNTVTVTGTVSASGGLTTTGAVAASGAVSGASVASAGAITAGGAIKREANFFLDFAGGVPSLTYDTGDGINFDRAANKFLFYIGGTVVASIDSAGNLKVTGNVTGFTAP